MPRHRAPRFSALLVALVASLAPTLSAEPPAASAADDAGKPPARVPGSSLPNGVVARINGKAILTDQFLSELYSALGDSYRDTFVDHVLIDQKAFALNVRVTSEEIEARVVDEVNRIQQGNFGGDAERMNEALAQRGLTLEGWKRRLRLDSRYETLLDKLILRDRTVPDETIKRLFEQKYGVGGIQLKVRHIQKNVQVAASADYTLQQFESEKAKIDEEAKHRAEDALAKIGQGRAFDEIMLAYSDDPKRAQGGGLGAWKGRFGTAFDEAAGKLRKGEHSGVIASTDGYRIVECTEVTPREEVHAAHILVAVGGRGNGRSEADAKKRADELLARIKGGEDLAALAKENSDDAASGSRGGDLGWFGRGAMVKPFEDAAFGMKAGELADQPVRSNFGFHIVKLLERRTEEDRTLRQIFVGTQFAAVKDRRVRPGLEAKARSALEAVLANLGKPGGSFEEAAKAGSDDLASKADGGLIATYREGAYGGDFDRTVRSMKAGDTPKIVIDAQGNYHLVKLDSVVQTELATVRDALIAEERARPGTPQERNDYLATLREKATIQF